MDSAYWNLFWTTGMPEAWLMSRGTAQNPGGVPSGEGWGLPGPVGNPQPQFTGTTPADPRGIV